MAYVAFFSKVIQILQHTDMGNAATSKKGDSAENGKINLKLTDDAYMSTDILCPLLRPVYLLVLNIALKCSFSLHNCHDVFFFFEDPVNNLVL